MGVYGALLTGVLGLQGQSTKMGAISDNIANVNTVGYKKADVPFQTLVTERVMPSNYAPGGVLSRPRLLIDQQGTISSSTSSTDIAVSGRGFFVVTQDSTGAADSEKLYSRAGSFREAIDPDSESRALLRNTAGFYLMGWPVDKFGELEVSQVASDLEVINTRRFEQTAEATTNVNWRANLPAEVSASAASITFFVNQQETISVTSENGDVRTATQNKPTRASFLAANNGASTAVTVTTSTTTTDVVFSAVLGGTTVNFTVGDLAGGTYAAGAEAASDAAIAAFVFGATGAGVQAAVRAAADTADDASITSGATPATIASRVAAAALAAGAVAPDDTNLGAAVQAAVTPFFTASGATTGGGASFASGDTLSAFVTRINGLTKSGMTLSASIDANGFLSIAAATSTGNQSAQISDVNVTLGGGLVADTTFASTNITAQTLQTSGEFGTNGAGFGTVFVEDFTSATTIFDALGAARTVQYKWKKRLDEPNLWEVRIDDNSVTGLVGRFDPTSATGTNNGARFMVTDGSQTVQTQRLLVKFTGEGALQEVRIDTDGTGTGQTTSLEGNTFQGIVANRESDQTKIPKLVSVAIGPVTLTGSTTGALATATSIPTGTAGFVDPETPSSIVYEWGMGRPTTLYGPGNQTASVGGTGLDGITQFASGEATPVIETFFFGQDGARVGQINGLAVDGEGYLVATYTNGLSRKIYRLPVATFANPNGLINKTGNAYGESEVSGSVQLNFADTGGAGKIFGSAVENSNVDLGDEFTNMIITQQAFTANTRVITTSDRMLEELVRILR